MKKIVEMVSGSIILLIIFVVTFVYYIFANAYVTKYLWEWYIVSTFGLPSLTLGQAFGISFIVDYLTWHHIDAAPKDRTQKEALYYSLGLLFRPIFTFLIGWIGSHYI